MTVDQVVVRVYQSVIDAVLANEKGRTGVHVRRNTHMNENSTRTIAIRKSYDFSKSVKNPYAKRFKKQITNCVDEESIVYVKELRKVRKTSE